MLSERIDEIKELFYREDCNLLFNPKNQNISKLKNSTALDFYLAIMNNNSVQDIVNSLVEKYSVDSEIVLRDLSNFTNSILQVSNHNVYRVNKGYNVSAK